MPAKKRSSQLLNISKYAFKNRIRQNLRFYISQMNSVNVSHSSTSETSVNIQNLPEIESLPHSSTSETFLNIQNLSEIESIPLVEIFNQPEQTENVTTPMDYNRTHSSTSTSFIDWSDIPEDYSNEILYESSSDSDSDDEYSNNLINDLRYWSTENNVPLSTVTKLLLILRKCGHSQLPKVAQTLLKTPNSTEVIEMSPGHYYHFGIKNNVIKLLRTENRFTDLTMDINVDGVPITNSGRHQFWPILGRLNEIDIKPFVIGLYYGLKKPDTCSEYLKYFVEEMKVINETGIIFNNRIYSLKINVFICDAPARAFIKGTKGHNAYFGCGDCLQEGEYVNNRMCFPETEFVPRTDESFRTRQQEEHHLEYSILEDIGIGMVSQFAKEYLHLILLGNVKKLLTIWTRGPLPHRLSAQMQLNISTKLINARVTQPKEFQRRIRGLDDLSFLKGTELRTILLYTGPVVLKDSLSFLQYNHFLSLHVAIHICIDQSKHQYLNIAKELLLQFVDKYKDVYDVCLISFNVHNLLHLIDDVN